MGVMEIFLFCLIVLLWVNIILVVIFILVLWIWCFLNNVEFVEFERVVNIVMINMVIINLISVNFCWWVGKFVVFIKLLFFRGWFNFGICYWKFFVWSLFFFSNGCCSNSKIGWCSCGIYWNSVIWWNFYRCWEVKCSEIDIDLCI